MKARITLKRMYIYLVYFICRTLAKHHIRKRWMYLVQSYRGQGSRNFNEEVSDIKNVENNHIRISYIS